MADIHVLFSQIRANAGDEIAQQGLDEMKRTEVNLTVESLCAIMQLEANRIQSGDSKKIDCQVIGEKIKQLVNQRINDLLNQFQAEKDLISQYFYQYSENQFLLMSSPAQILWHDICRLNLSKNFEEIALKLKDFSFQDSNRIFTCLVIQIVQSRTAQRIAMLSALC